MEKEPSTNNHLSRTRKLWETKHQKDEWTGGKREIKRVTEFFDKYKDQIGHEILDLGSGHGRNAISLAKRGYNLTCLELTEAGLKRTEEKFQEAGLEAALIQGDQNHLPFQDGKFDTVVNVQSFQFNITKWDAEKAFAEAARVLKPGGIFFFRVRSEKFNGGDHRIFDEEGRLMSRGYSLQEIENLVVQNDMEIIEEPVDSYHDDREGNIIGEGQWNIVMRKKI